MKGIPFFLSPVALRIVVAAAVLCVGAGCSAPDGDERARFGVVSGIVVDADNNTVAGAQVRVVDQVPGAQIGTQNYFGERGPFVTNSRGQFTISGVQVAPSDRVVLNLEVTHPSYLTGYASNVAPVTTQIAGGFLNEGERTRDILIQDQNVGDVLVVLQKLGITTIIGMNGGEISVPVPRAGFSSAVPAVFITISIPAGAFSRDTAVTITPLTPDGLVRATAALPAVIPTPGVPAAPSSPSALNQANPVEFGMIAPFSAFAFTVGGTPGFVFPAGKEPTVRCPLPIRLPPGTSVPIMEFTNEAVTRGRVQLSAYWRFVTDGLVGPGGRVVEFKVLRPGIYAAVTEMRWALHATINDGSREVRDFNPLVQFPNGYLATSLNASLTFQGLNDSDHPQELAFIRGALAAVMDDVVHGPIRVVVPRGDEWGIRCTPVKRDIALRLIVVRNVNEFQYSGLWSFWKQQRTQLPKLDKVPPHLQGHVQGGGIER